MSALLFEKNIEIRSKSYIKRDRVTRVASNTEYNEAITNVKTLMKQTISVILTHIKLSYKAGKVVVFEILRQYFPCKCSLIVDKKARTTLQENENIDFELLFPTKSQPNRQYIELDITAVVLMNYSVAHSSHNL